MLCGRNAVHPAGAPLDMTDQVGPRRQQRKLEVNLKATIARPCDALTGPAFAAISPLLPLALQHSLRHVRVRNVPCLVMCCRG